MDAKEFIAEQAASLLKPGQVVNLGIGIPTLVINYLTEEDEVYIHSENGILGVRSLATPEEMDEDLVNAGKIGVTIHKGAAFFDSAQSFAMIRGGHVDVAIIGALQVDESGRVANWSVPGQNVFGVGGAMDLMEGAREIIVAFTHTTKDGKPKLVKQLSYPPTSLRSADYIVTELGTFHVRDGRLKLIRLAPGVTIDRIREATEASFDIELQGGQ